MLRRLYSMRALILLVAVLVVPALACEFSASTATITNAVTAKDAQGENKEPVGITDTFGPEQRVFHAVVTIANAPSDTTLKAVWTAIDVGSAAAPNTLITETEVKVEGSRNVDFTLTPTGDSWPPGVYKVNIYLNGKLDRTLNFRVEGAPAQPTVAPKPTTAAPPTSSAPKPSGYVNNVTLAESTTGDKEPVNPTVVFKPTGTFHAVVRTQNAPANTKFKAAWYVVDVGSVAPPNSVIDQTELTTDGSRNIDFTLKPSTQWPGGTYRVEVWVNDVLDRVVNFSVAGTTAPSTVAPTRPATAAPPTQARPTAPPTAASGRPPIPAGQGGLMVVSSYGKEINFTINNILYKIPPNGTITVFLPPGKHPYSANIPGVGSASNIIEITAGQWFTQTFSE